jgi:hypothetical protein
MEDGRLGEMVGCGAAHPTATHFHWEAMAGILPLAEE